MKTNEDQLKSELVPMCQQIMYSLKGIVAEAEKLRLEMEIMKKYIITYHGGPTDAEIDEMAKYHGGK